MPLARLIVCEKTGRWAVGLRRELVLVVPVCRAGVVPATTFIPDAPEKASPARGAIAAPPRVYETRSLADCWVELAASPASFLVLEVTDANVELLTSRLAELRRRFPLAGAMVCGDRAMARYEWLLREAGALHVVFSPRELAPAARLAVRHLAAVPEPPCSLRERVWARLPWRGRATSCVGE